MKQWAEERSVDVNHQGSHEGPVSYFPSPSFRCEASQSHVEEVVTALSESILDIGSKLLTYVDVSTKPTATENAISTHFRVESCQSTQGGVISSTRGSPIQNVRSQGM